MKQFHTFLLILIGLNLTAQTKIEKERIKKFNNSVELNNIVKKKQSITKSELKSIALLKGWDYEIIDLNSYSVLVGINKNGQPVYYQTYNEGAGITSRANTLYTGGILGLNINGENMLAGVWDAGQALPTHELFSGRITVMDNAANSHFHATHVAGTVIGTDAVENGDARGMAYMANGHSYDWNDDLSEVAAAANNGLLISNHSYGVMQLL